MQENDGKVWRCILWSVALLIIFICLCMFIYPPYNVWASEKHGLAELAQATANRQIKIQEAHAIMESSKMLADAEVIRAKGVANANKIIGDSLKGNEGYLYYLWIHNLAETKNEIIYVPTEANLPILEAGKRFHPAKQP